MSQRCENSFANYGIHYQKFCTKDLNWPIVCRCNKLCEFLGLVTGLSQGSLICSKIGCICCVKGTSAFFIRLFRFTMFTATLYLLDYHKFWNTVMDNSQIPTCTISAKNFISLNKQNINMAKQQNIFIYVQINSWFNYFHKHLCKICLHTPHKLGFTQISHASNKTKI